MSALDFNIVLHLHGSTPCPGMALDSENHMLWYDIYNVIGSVCENHTHVNPMRSKGSKLLEIQSNKKHGKVTSVLSLLDTAPGPLGTAVVLKLLV